MAIFRNSLTHSTLPGVDMGVMQTLKSSIEAKGAKSSLVVIVLVAVQVVKFNYLISQVFQFFFSLLISP